MRGGEFGIPLLGAAPPSSSQPEARGRRALAALGAPAQLTQLPIFLVLAPHLFLYGPPVPVAARIPEGLSRYGWELWLAGAGWGRLYPEPPPPISPRQSWDPFAPDASPSTIPVLPPLPRGALILSVRYPCVTAGEMAVFSGNACLGGTARMPGTAESPGRVPWKGGNAISELTPV